MSGVDVVNQAYADGLAEGHLLLQRCGDCGRHQFYPRIACSHCTGSKLTWVRAAGGGQIASFTVVRRGVSADFTAPYVVALVDLDEGVRMMTHIIDADPEQLEIGMPVFLEFQQVAIASGRLPVFRPAAP